MCHRLRLQYLFTAEPLSGGTSVTATSSVPITNIVGLAASTQVGGRVPGAACLVIGVLLAACFAPGT